MPVPGTWYIDVYVYVSIRCIQCCIHRVCAGTSDCMLMTVQYIHTHAYVQLSPDTTPIEKKPRHVKLHLIFIQICQLEFLRLFDYGRDITHRKENVMIIFWRSQTLFQ